MIEQAELNQAFLQDMASRAESSFLEDMASQAEPSFGSEPTLLITKSLDISIKGIQFKFPTKILYITLQELISIDLMNLRMLNFLNKYIFCL